MSRTYSFRDQLFHFLRIERTLGGLDVFLPYIKDYVNAFMGKSITTQQWKDHLYAYYGTHGTRDNIEALDSIDWQVLLATADLVTRFRCAYLCNTGMAVRRGAHAPRPDGI